MLDISFQCIDFGIVDGVGLFSIVTIVCIFSGLCFCLLGYVGILKTENLICLFACRSIYLSIDLVESNIRCAFACNFGSVNM